jgi:hypothetical protein
MAGLLTCEQLWVVHALRAADDLLPADEHVKAVAVVGVIRAGHRVEGPDLQCRLPRTGSSKCSDLQINAVNAAVGWGDWLWGIPLPSTMGAVALCRSIAKKQHG